MTPTPTTMILAALRAEWIALGHDYTLPIATGTQFAAWHQHEKWIVTRDRYWSSFYAACTTATTSEGGAP